MEQVRQGPLLLNALLSHSFCDLPYSICIEAAQSLLTNMYVAMHPTRYGCSVIAVVGNESAVTHM